MHSLNQMTCEGINWCLPDPIWSNRFRNYTAYTPTKPYIAFSLGQLLFAHILCPIYLSLPSANLKWTECRTFFALIASKKLSRQDDDSNEIKYKFDKYNNQS